MKRIDLRVEGMTCSSCVKHVSAALTPITGVTEVSVDLSAGRVYVGGDADAQVLISALREAGYPASVETTGPVVESGKARGCCGSCSCH